MNDSVGYFVLIVMTKKLLLSKTICRNKVTNLLIGDVNYVPYVQYRKFKPTKVLFDKIFLGGCIMGPSTFLMMKCLCSFIMKFI